MTATSHEHTTKLQHIILETLKSRATGYTTREISYITGLDFATVTPRMAPMAEVGWVHMTHNKRKAPHGKGYGHVWIITARGLGVIA